jgi:hypothetical protein
MCFFTIKVTVFTFIIGTFTKKKTDKQLLNNLSRMEQNYKYSNLKNPELGKDVMIQLQVVIKS